MLSIHSEYLAYDFADKNRVLT